MHFLRKFGLAVAAVLLLALPVSAATLPLVTGPAGSNPVANPAVLPDMNTLINSINASVAPAGVGQPSLALGVGQITTAKLGPTQATALQFIANVTSTTGSSTCNATNASECLGILDAAGVLHWLPLY